MDSLSQRNKFCYLLYLYTPTRYQSRFFAYGILFWIVGVLGNLVNIAVFRHKNMAHPINSIFLWLSISDLLELVVIATSQWLCEWCGSLRMLNIITFPGGNFEKCVLILISQYLLQVFHAITIGLNIVLAFCQYKVVAHPFINQKNLFNNQFIKCAIIWTYILSFVLYLPFWYIYEIGPHIDSISFYMFYWRRSRHVKSWPPMNPLVHICFLVCGVVLRIGPLIILIIFCALLLFAINNAHRKRRGLGMEARQLSKAQRKVNRMNVTVIIVITMFLITEVPSAISTFVYVQTNNFHKCSHLIDYYILFPVMLLNCCYSIFCYLIRIKEYRETLKLLLNKINWIRSRARVVEQTNLELHSL